MHLTINLSSLLWAIKFLPISILWTHLSLFTHIYQDVSFAWLLLAKKMMFRGHGKAAEVEAIAGIALSLLALSKQRPIGFNLRCHVENGSGVVG